jgi:hypothetical protein
VAKRVTVLLYLNPASEAWARQEGCLRLLRGPDDVEDYAAEIPPVDGTLLIFPNGPTTWHGHRQYVGRRYTISSTTWKTTPRPGTNCAGTACPPWQSACRPPPDPERPIRTPLRPCF